MLLQKRVSRHHQAYKQTLPTFSQVSQLPRASNDLHAKRNHKSRNRTLQTLQQGRTRISITVIMSVLSAPKRSGDTHEVSGLAEHVGPCSTWVVSKSGRQTKVQPLPVSKLKMANNLRRDSGGAQVAIYQRTFCQRIFIVGVRRSSIPRLCQGCHRSRAARRALDHESCQRVVLTRVQSLAMPALARLVV
jgi:hypothetical protein